MKVGSGPIFMLLPNHMLYTDTIVGCRLFDSWLQRPAAWFCHVSVQDFGSRLVCLLKRPHYLLSCPWTLVHGRSCRYLPMMQDSLNLFLDFVSSLATFYPVHHS